MAGALALIWSKYSGTILVVAAFVAVMAGAYWVGHRSGRVDQLQDSVQAYEKREGIDNDTNALARRAVCLKLGGVPEQCDELRRMDETAAGQ